MPAKVKKQLKKTVVKQPAKATRKAPPSYDECQLEAQKLRELMPRIRRFSSFGDDHFTKIEAQILVLEEDLDDEKIGERFSDDVDVEHAAIDARRWADGESGVDKPTTDWESLVIK